MAVHARQPSHDELRALLARCRDDDLTYAPTGGSLGGERPPGLTPRAWSTVLTGPGAFARAKAALVEWSMHERAGLGVVADGPLEVGTNVALSAPLPVGFVDAPCRIVAVIDEAARFGFAYGTLSVHPERGEEAFVVSESEQGVQFDISAVSRAVHPLARLAPPIANRMQDTAVRRYLHAMDQLTR